MSLLVVAQKKKKKGLDITWSYCNNKVDLNIVNDAHHKVIMTSHGCNVIACCCNQKGLRHGMILQQQLN